MILVAQVIKLMEIITVALFAEMGSSLTANNAMTIMPMTTTVALPIALSRNIFRVRMRLPSAL